MCQVIQYCVETGELRLQIKLLKPHNNLHGVIGHSDFDYAKDSETGQSVGGYSVLLNGLPVQWKSKMQDRISFSVPEAELIAATSCSQQMIYGTKVLDWISF